MSKVEEFLTAIEETEVIDAIRKAEYQTSGEIRVHLESHFKKEAMTHAIEIFNKLQMNNTKHSNGVLIYVAVKDHTLVILGDEGINKVVPDDFWESTKNIIISYFKKGNTKNGLVEGILKAGEQLKKYFPYSIDDDNELPDSISFSEK